jgi:HNH endonuclease
MYDHPADAASCAKLDFITLKPGVTACMRSLRTVIAAMVQARWAQWVREHNRVLGPSRGLEAFMFGTDRIPLRQYATWLYEIQNRRCFYTNSKLASPANGMVDHFLPRARYPIDEPVNLVLASKRANSDKSDRLASGEYLKTWAERNTSLELPKALAARYPEGRIELTWPAARSIALWMYGAAESERVQTWKGVGKFGKLDSDWQKWLRAG